MDSCRNTGQVRHAGLLDETTITLLLHDWWTTLWSGVFPESGWYQDPDR
jgi:hypothetical protein